MIKFKKDTSYNETRFNKSRNRFKEALKEYQADKSVKKGECIIYVDFINRVKTREPIKDKEVA